MNDKKQNWLQAIEDAMESAQDLTPLTPEFKEDLKAKLLKIRPTERVLPRLYVYMAAASFALLLMTNIWAYRTNTAASATSDRDGYEELINSYQLLSPNLGSINRL